MKYPTIFNLIADVFKKTGVSGVLIGGFAVNCYKVTRHTGDIDFLVTDEAYKKLLPLFRKSGFRERARAKVCARLETAKGYLTDIDFVFVDQKTFDSIAADGKKIKVAGETFPVPSLEHLIALKLHAIKNHFETRQFKDLPDIVNLIRENKMNIRSLRFRQLCLKYGSQALYDRIISGVG